jgi:hypothetical protein
MRSLGCYNVILIMKIWLLLKYIYIIIKSLYLHFIPNSIFESFNRKMSRAMHVT